MVYYLQTDIERCNNQTGYNVEDGQQPSRIHRFLANHRSHSMKQLPLHRARNLFVHKLVKYPRLITITANPKEACFYQETEWYKSIIWAYYCFLNEFTSVRNIMYGRKCLWNHGKNFCQHPQLHPVVPSEQVKDSWKLDEVGSQKTFEFCRLCSILQAFSLSTIRSNLSFLYFPVTLISLMPAKVILSPVENAAVACTKYFEREWNVKLSIINLFQTHNLLRRSFEPCGFQRYLPWVPTILPSARFKMIKVTKWRTTT